MQPTRHAKSGYARLAQADEEQEDAAYSDIEEPLALNEPQPEYEPIQPKRRESMSWPSNPTPSRRQGRRRTNSRVDIQAINERLERWAEEIKERFTLRRSKGRTAEDRPLEIYSSVFQAPDWIQPATRETLENEYDDANERVSKAQFDEMVESVRTAIEFGMHPTLISQGSSGSYFARNSGGKILGVFKPKDEEPYANRNPKWTKWLQRNLLPFAFGRMCLISNLSYVSEAAAYVLDCQLRTNLVPHTDIVHLSSQSFHYDWFDKRQFYRRRKPLPEKPGSFQVFLKGYKGATEFLLEHPWPDQHAATFKDAPARKRRRRWDETCGPGGGQPDEVDIDDEDGALTSQERSRARREFWTEDLQQSFREQLEKLVILDYVMRNTDRGTDNWMIRIDREKNQATIVVDPPMTANGYQRRDETMVSSPAKKADEATPRIGAIDNSLSFPWQHPDGWRSYPFGWLFLPVSLIGRPFSYKTQQHFLPLLTSKQWWAETQKGLRESFQLDPDFQEKMHSRQIAVLKGQAWNVVEALKTPDHGPLELTRRPRVLVWDDVVDIPVAVPLTRPSEDTRRTAGTSQIDQRPKDTEDVEETDEDEMDISAAYSASQPHTSNYDPLGASAPGQESPFNHSRQSRQPDLRPGDASVQTPPRPTTFRTSSRVSPEVPRKSSPWHSSAERMRRFSFGVRGGSGFDEELADDDGDLGYNAAGREENMMRKVIVERLEMVKTKGPFFSWC